MSNPNSLVLYGECVSDSKLDRVLPDLMEVNSEMTIAMCLSYCRSNGYSYAGVEYKEECHCGNYPEGGFESRYTWPNKCDMQCPGDSSQNCGGAGAMSVWSVPHEILHGLCVYDHPFDGRVLPEYSITGIDNLTQWSCQDICFKKGEKTFNTFLFVHLTFITLK